MKYKKSDILFIMVGLILTSCLMISCQNDESQTFQEAVTNLHPSGDLEHGDTLYVPQDLKAEVWAESPQFYNPTNMDVDKRGRIWVTEAVDYRDFNNKPGEGFKHFPKGDRVMILEDTDGDGKCDSSKVFVQDKDLVAPLGIAVLGKKVVVSSSPSMIVYTDTDGDDHPDKKETFLTGFGGKDHDHGLHAVVPGPDGKWYFTAGDAGPHIVTDKSGWTLRAGSIYTGGTPYNKSNKPGLISDDGRIWVGGVTLRVNNDGTGLKVMAHNFRNSYEVALDSYGNMWGNDNDDQVVSCRTLWVMEGANAGYFNKDGSRFWQADRRPGQDIPTAHWHQEDPGVIPDGDITGSGAPTGMVVYESYALGPEYRGMVLSADAGRNEIFGYKPLKKGAGYKLNHYRFISSVHESTKGYVWSKKDVKKNKWFRPSDVAVGPDGALYIADWYDGIVGGHQMTDKKGYGRIYRIEPKNKTLKNPSIDLGNTQGQIQALLNPAKSVRYLGFKKLKERGPEVIDDVKEILSDYNPYHRARAVWLLANLGPKGIAETETLFKDENQEIRITAFRALRQTNPDKVLDYARQLSKDGSPAVRREVAIALRDTPLKDCKDIIVNLVEGYKNRDRWYLDALGLALDGKEDRFYPTLIDKFGDGVTPSQWSDKVADLVWELHPKSAVKDLTARAESENVSVEERKRAITALGFINATAAAEAMISVSKTENSTIAQNATWWLQYRKTNNWGAYLGNWKAPSSTHALQKHPRIVALNDTLVNESLPLSKRTEAAQEMAEDSVGGIFLISLAAQHKLPGKIKADISKTIFKNPDQYVRGLAHAYFKDEKEHKNYDIDHISSLKSKINDGKNLFYQKCIICHSTGNGGGRFGPSLANINRKYDKKGLLNAIVHPGASIAFGFEPYLITTKDGKAAYGLLRTEGDIVVLKGIYDDQYVFNADNINSKIQLSTSIMPRPYTFQIGDQELADLTKYIMNLNE